MSDRRVMGLEQMWDEFYREHHREIESMHSEFPPREWLHCWSARFADFVLDQDEDMIKMCCVIAEKVISLSDEAWPRPGQRGPWGPGHKAPWKPGERGPWDPGTAMPKLTDKPKPADP